MSVLNIFLQDEGPLLGAPDAYLPLPATATADTAYAHWTRKLASQRALGVARELAGLSEPRLAELASEFARIPQRQRTDKLRLSFPLAAVLLVSGVVILILEATLRTPGNTGVSLLQGLALGCLAGSVSAIGFGALAAFAIKPLEVAHTKLGQCLGLLDEQHPWLYDAASLAMRNAAADAYRQRTLLERGPLRGIDYLMMCEIAHVNDALDMTRIARSVAECLNTIETPNAGSAAREPRLTSVAASNVSNAGAASTGVKESQVKSIRPVESNGVDRRRPTAHTVNNTMPGFI